MSQPLVQPFSQHKFELLQELRECKSLREALGQKAETLAAFLEIPLPTTEPIAEYITEPDKRWQIWKTLKGIQEDFEDAGVSLAKLNATAFGIVMVAPINRLQEFVLDMSDPCDGLDAKYQKLVQGAFWQLCDVSVRAMRDYFAKRGPRHGQRRLALSPDGSGPAPCIICGIRDPIATPILAPCTRTEHIRSILELFWDRHASAGWISLVEDAELINSDVNFLSLERSLRYRLDNAKIALRPLRRDNPNEITVQFYWLHDPVYTPRQEDDLKISSHQHWVPQGDVCRQDGWPVKTGQIYVIRSEDPEKLPNFELLKLQWELHRVGGICGAAQDSEWFKE